MQVVNKKMCVIVILVLVIIESCTLFLMYKSYGNKNNTLDEVNLNINNTNMFAIMLEQEDGTYKEDTTSTWPTSGYTYNDSMSGCIDINGNKLDGVLSYDSTNNIATVDTGNTSYCYLYFSRPNASEYLLQNPSSGLNTTIEAGMYRYQGTDNVDNHICFGTNNKLDCTNNTATYMYRIIGIAEEGQMKLIKKEILNTSVAWWSDDTTDVIWPNSLIYIALNGNDYLLNNTYVPTGWESKIATTTWKYGDATSNGGYDGPTIYAIEDSWANTISAKIGLMYIHDYYYAYASGGSPENPSNAKTAWIHLSNNVPLTNVLEWLMSRLGGSSSFRGWTLASSDGIPTLNYLDSARLVRPVFYLKSDVKITGGTGTSTDPYIIN
ncbi:MAG: hypothetical protein IJN13_04630 [Bacilli bacterium]|nr:hypothetical protein [Bacilli bacterium]